MLKRRNTVSSPNPAMTTVRRNGRIRRSKTVSTTLTKSEMMAPEERNQQAVAAAKRAYGDDMYRRRSQIVRFETPVSSSEDTDTGYHQDTAESPNVSGRTIRVVDGGENDNYLTDYDLPEHCDMGNTKEKGKSDWHANMQQRFTSRGRRSMNFTTTDAEDYPGSYQSSNPSSYRRIQKTRSMFSVGQIFSKDLPQDEYSSSVVYSSERSPDSMSSKNRRKSTSFLRGGTDFMSESVRRRLEEEKTPRKERKSFYQSGSARHGAFLETVRGKKKDPEESGPLSMRKAVGEKARKMSASFFGTMRRALGRKVKLEPSFPEQHITSTRQHFRDYVSPSELHDDIMDIPKPNNLTIRPAVISRAPTFRHVPSCEMMHSVAGSLGEATPPIQLQPPIRVLSTTTDGKSTWNATLGASLHKKRLSIIDENIPNKVKDNIYTPPSVEEQQVQKGYEAKRVYSALMKRLDRGSPSAKREEAEYVHGPGYIGPGYYMAPGLALRPEEENMFERPYTAVSTNTVVTAIRKSNIKLGHELKGGDDVPPPVPTRPLPCQQRESSKSKMKEWIVSTPADEELRQMSTDSQLAELVNQASGLATKPGERSRLPVDTPTTLRNQSRGLRVTKSASTFFPYSSPVGELRESTPTPYRKAAGIMDTGSSSSAHTDITITPQPRTENPPPPQMVALTQQPSKYTHGGVYVAPIAPKMKIRSGLKIKNYNPDWNRIKTVTPNENRKNTPRSTPRSTVSSIGMNENYTSAKLNMENETRNRKPKVLLRPGSQGLGIPPVVYRSRSVLSQISTLDIENAVNTQFGPVVGGEGMDWKGKGKQKVREERTFSERRMESHVAFI